MYVYMYSIVWYILHVIYVYIQYKHIVYTCIDINIKKIYIHRSEGTNVENSC